MKILFIGTDLDVFNLFQLALSYEFGVDLEHVHTPELSVDLLESNTSYKMIIVLLPLEEEPKKLFDLLGLQKIPIPLLFTADNSTISECHKYLKFNTLTSRVSYESHHKIIVRSFERLLSVGKRIEKENQGYSAIPLNFFYTKSFVKTDVYMKINEKKYLRIFRARDTITQDDMNKYRDKGVTHLYLKHTEFLETTNEFMQNVREKLERTKMETKHLNFVTGFAHDSICKLIPELGIKEEVLLMVGDAILNLKEVMSRKFDMKMMMKNILKGDGYKSEHSLFLVYLSCATLRETQWHSLENLDKLTVASFFHDLFVEDNTENLSLSDDITKIKVPKATMKKYINHPFLAIEFLEKLSDISPDVGKIILNHHEKPDGTGFPHGNNWKKIFPLAAIFIVAEDFSNCIYAGGNDHAFIEDILDDFEQKYYQGNFKKALEGLRSSLGLQKLLAPTEGESSQRSA